MRTVEPRSRRPKLPARQIDSTWPRTARSIRDVDLPILPRATRRTRRPGGEGHKWPRETHAWSQKTSFTARRDVCRTDRTTRRNLETASKCGGPYFDVRQNAVDRALCASKTPSQRRLDTCWRGGESAALDPGGQVLRQRTLEGSNLKKC